jgi:hypothetical protein
MGRCAQRQKVEAYTYNRINHYEATNKPRPNLRSKAQLTYYKDPPNANPNRSLKRLRKIHP